MVRTEEEKAQWKDSMKNLVKRIGKMTPEEREEVSRRMPIVTCEGHALSYANNVLLILQSAGAPITVVAGFKQWRKAGRVVNAGQHAIGSIWVPLNSKKNGNGNGNGNGNAEEDTETEERTTHFRFVPVFDISQTAEIGGQAQ